MTLFFCGVVFGAGLVFGINLWHDPLYALYHAARARGIPPHEAMALAVAYLAMLTAKKKGVSLVELKRAMLKLVESRDELEREEEG